MTRTGKIARLSWSLREELNGRLRDGEPGKKLADWLNSLPAVQEVLRKEFGERLISEQNLSEWKQGGYEEWVRHQETRTWVQELATQAADIREDIKEEAGDLSVADLLAAPLAIALGRQLPSLAAKATDDPKQVQKLLDVARELTRLSRDDYSQKCLGFQRERWETELKFKLLTLISKGPKQPGSFRERLTQTLLQMVMHAVTRRYEFKKKRGSLSAKEEAHYQEALAKLLRWQCTPREAEANEHILVAAAGSQDPERFL